MCAAYSARAFAESGSWSCSAHQAAEGWCPAFARRRFATQPAGDETIANVTDAATRTAEASEALLRHGAVFAYLHGSRADDTARPTSDIDIAAYFGGQQQPQAFDVLLPSGVDLLVLDKAPLELAGRVAMRGKLLFETDRAMRVAWEATTRKIYLDELPRITRAHREFAEAVRRGR